MVETKKAMGKLEVKNHQGIMRTFGDEQSSLLDHFERLSVKVQLNQAMLRRSLSEPAYIRPQQPLLLTHGPSQPPPPPPPPPVTKKRRGSGFNKVLRKMIKPILSRMTSASKKKEIIPDAKDARLFWKTFSRSVRL